MGMISEFKEFAMRGNVIDLAVGVVIGTAFGKIVASLVNDLIMPVVGNAVGGVNFDELAWELQPASVDASGAEVAAVLVKYGAFIQTIVDFTIIAFAIFIAVKVINRLQRKQEEAPPAPAEPSDEVKLLTEIRDTLKAR
jgi:large conductance mechanosensitive channel